MNVNNKIILITGGSSGIGKATAELFLKKGAKIIVFGLNKPSFKSEFFKVDVSNEKQIKNALSNIKKIDVLINNAGIAEISKIEDTSTEQMIRMLDTNFKGVFWMCKHSLNKISKEGCIINISSIAGLKSFEEFGIYSATKSAVISLTKTLAIENSNKKIRVNSIAPGIIDTEIWEKMYGKNGRKNLHENEKYVPLQRSGKPEEVAKTAVFICENDYINGETIVVDGGELCK